MSTIPRGRFAWYELMTTDPDAAQDFYGAVVGWGARPWDGGDEPYTMWMNGEAPVGGFVQLPADLQAQGVPPHWLAHITTPDVDATAARAQELGAAVVHRLTVPTVGSFAVIRDPHGAVFSAFQPEGDAPGHDGPPQAGEFSWNELMTGDWNSAWTFYSDLFGWEVDSQMDMGPEHGVYHMYKGNGRTLGGMMNRHGDMPVAWLHYVRILDLDGAVTTVKDKGGQVVVGPMEVPGGDRVAVCLDPQGGAFALHQKG